MKYRKIRFSCFETNSSSCHTISFGSDRYIVKQFTIKKGDLDRFKKDLIPIPVVEYLIEKGLKGKWIEEERRCLPLANLKMIDGYIDVDNGFYLVKINNKKLQLSQNNILDPETFWGHDSTIDIYPGEFGWGYDVLSSIYDKISYLYTFALMHSKYGNNEYMKKLKSFLDKNRHGIGVEPKFEYKLRDDEFYPEGYIDHQSEDKPEKVFLSDKTMRNYLFNPNTHIIIDNDNH